MFLQFILIIITYFGVASPSLCPPYEYRAGWECCPSCLPGHHVVKDCTERMITKCSRCPEGTFQAGYNEQKQCSNCTKCESGLGLKVKKSCSPTSDAVCENLDGFFGSDSNGGGRGAARRHTVCSPGQYIGQRGTADKDTECLHCTDGTFSNGTSSCQPHTTCDSGVQKQPGTDSTDSTCIPYVAIVFIIIGCILLISIIALGAWVYRRPKKGKEKQGWQLHGGAAGEGTPGPSSTPLLSTELPAGLETSIPPAPSSETQPAGLETSIPPAPSTETQPAEVPTSDGPEPTRDQQECTITIPDGTIVDHHGDQSLGPAPPSSLTHNGSVSVSDHQEDDQPVHTKRDHGASRSPPLSLRPPSTSKSSLLSLRPPSPSWSSLLSLGLPSTSRSARRFRVRSKSESSCLANPKLPTDCVALLMDDDIDADEEVLPVCEIRDQPESESDDSNSLKPVPIRRDHGVSQVTPLIPSARRRRFRSKSESSHFNIPSPGGRASLLKGNDIAEEEEEWPVLENLD